MKIPLWVSFVDACLGLAYLRSFRNVQSWRTCCSNILTSDLRTNPLLTVLPQILHSIGYSELAYLHWQVLRISNAASRLMLEPKFSKNFRLLNSSAENYRMWKRKLTHTQTLNSCINSQISWLITKFLRIFDIFPK